MKKLLAMLGVAMAVAMAQGADHKSLLTDDDAWVLYTRPSLSTTAVDGDWGPMGNITVGWILNDRFSIGPTASILLGDLSVGDGGTLDRFGLWYAGVRMDYTFKASQVVHGSLSLRLGGGEFDASFTPNQKNNNPDGIYVVEPGVSFGVNVTASTEVGVDLSYRWMDGVKSGNLQDADASGVAIGIYCRVLEF